MAIGLFVYRVAGYIECEGSVPGAASYNRRRFIGTTKGNPMSETIGTTCVQGGWRPGDGDPRQVPIYQNTTWKYGTSEAMGRLFDLEDSGYFYTRLANPTCDAVAAKIAELEGGTAAMLTSSGQAANFLAVLNLAGAGDHIVSSASIYGGTYNLLAHTLRRMGVECTFVDPDCTDEDLEAAFRPNTKLVFGEAIANPALTVLDIERFAVAAHAHGVPLIVDNTFPTPVLCRPLEWGADIVTPMAPRWAASSWTAAASTGRRTLTGSPASPSLTRATTAWCTPSASGRAARSSRRRRPSSCAIWAAARARRTRSC